MMSSVTGNLCNKCPKQLVEQNSRYSDYFNAISGFTLNSIAPGGPVTLALQMRAHCGISNIVLLHVKASLCRAFEDNADLNEK